VIHLFLLDIDGVLVQPRGYLQALQDTVSHFSRLMGVGDHPPTEEDIQVFEANGLTSEWDSGAMCVAALLLQRLRRQPDLRLPTHWSQALALLSAQPAPLPRPDYAALAREAGERIAAGMVPAQAMQAVIRRQARALPGSRRSDPALHHLLDELVGWPHDFYRSPVTRYFQYLSIGHEEVTRTYGVAPAFESPAYLLAYDRPNLSAATRAHLEQAIAAGRVRVALFTLRPSLPPAGGNVSLASYSPEAELARSLVKLEACPIIGLGHMHWLAARSGHAIRDLIKPSPVQALAATGAAWSGREIPALQAALALVEDGLLAPPLADLAQVTLHIFEDSLAGMAAVQRSADLLQKSGLDCTCRCYGVVPPHGPKAEAMTSQEVELYPSIDEALEEALARAAGPPSSSLPSHSMP